MPKSKSTPTFSPVAVDKYGRIIPMSQEEREARQAALSRVLDAASRSDRLDPPELFNDDDVVARLRRYDAAFGGDLMLEAAEEIERLRKAL